MIQKILITLLVNLMPYYFTKFAFFRCLVYKSFNKHLPINLHTVKEIIDNPHIYEIV